MCRLCARYAYVDLAEAIRWSSDDGAIISTMGMVRGSECGPKSCLAVANAFEMCVPPCASYAYVDLAEVNWWPHVNDGAIMSTILLLVLVLVMLSRRELHMRPIPTIRRGRKGMTQRISLAVGIRPLRGLLRSSGRRKSAGSIRDPAVFGSQHAAFPFLASRKGPSGHPMPY